MGINGATENNVGYTATVTAIFSGSAVVTDVLLSRTNLNINAQGVTGNTPLMWAALWGQYDIADSLLKQNADVTLKNKDGYNALQLAAQNGHKDVVNLLRSYGAR
jgi:ankyrin repeat protein